MSRQESMRRHPSHVARHIAQDREAVELANSGRLDRLNEVHHEVSTGPNAWLVDIVVPLAIGLVLFAAIWGSAFLGELFAGWPL